MKDKSFKIIGLIVLLALGVRFYKQGGLPSFSMPSFGSSSKADTEIEIGRKVSKEVAKRGLHKTLRDIYFEELEKCPIPVKLMSITKYAKLMGQSRSEASSTLGSFVIQSSNPSLPKKFIYIRNDISTEQSLFVYFHELGHYTCYKEGCSCFRNRKDDTETEYHAYWWQTKYCIEKKLPEALKMSIRLIEAKAKERGRDPHVLAAKKIQNTQMWADGKQYIKNEKWAKAK